jgi:NAD(P)-dependent dehydrogenase (short-subunit alcohol dehydrogenase family)
MSTQKIVLITGASRGIGAATARLAAAAQGYDVAVNFVRDKAAAAAVVADIEKAGRRAVAIQADVSREQDVERLFATIDEKLGRLTHLVFNSGVTGPVSRIDGLATDAAREILDVNVLGAFLCARAAIPRMSKAQGGAGGAMVLISSAMATLGGPGEYVMYATSKGAVESLSIGLSREVAAEGIRVNVVEPIKRQPRECRTPESRANGQAISSPPDFRSLSAGNLPAAAFRSIRRANGDGGPHRQAFWTAGAKYCK